MYLGYYVLTLVYPKDLYYVLTLVYFKDFYSDYVQVYQGYLLY